MILVFCRALVCSCEPLSSALHWAAKECSITCIELLLAAAPPASVDAVSDRGQKAVDVIPTDHAKAAEARSLLDGIELCIKHHVYTACTSIRSMDREWIYLRGY